MSFGLLQLNPGGQLMVRRNIGRHVSVLLLILVVDWGWGFFLDRYDLVYSTLGVVYGAGYTASHVTMTVLWIMVGYRRWRLRFSRINFFRPRFKALIFGAAAYAVLYVAGMIALPQLFQKFVVQPERTQHGTPLPEELHSVHAQGLWLDAIQETSYPALPDLTPDVIARNQDTIQNIRLVGPKAVAADLSANPGHRLYYQFYNVDVDRYHLRMAITR